LKETPTGKKVVLVMNNLDKQLNIFFYNVGFSIEVLKYYSPREMLDLVIKN